MARLLKLKSPGEGDLERTLIESGTRPTIVPDPLWEKRFKYDPRWLTDRWVLRSDGARKSGLKR